MNHRQMALLIDWVRDRRHWVPSGGPLPICLWGHAGVGKTSGVRNYCKHRARTRTTAFPFLSYQPVHDVTGADLIGEKVVKSEGRSVSVRYVPPLWLPDPERIATGLEPRDGIVFIDEPNRAAPAVTNGLLELYQERGIGKSGYSLPPGYSVMSAANYDFDGRNRSVSTMDDALLNRMLHVNLSFSADGWLGYMADQARAPQVLQFARQNLDRMPAEQSELPDEFHVPVSPRSFENLACLYEPGMDRWLLTVIAQGLVGKDLAREFVESIDELEALESCRGQLTADAVFDAHWEGALAADIAAGNAYNVHAVATELVARLEGWSVADSAAERVAEFVAACPQRTSDMLVAEMTSRLPEWWGAVSAALPAARERSAEARAAGTTAPSAASQSELARGLTGEHILHGTWEALLAADLDIGNVERIRAAGEAVVKSMEVWEPAPAVAEPFARYLARVPSAVAAELVEAIRVRAPGWIEPVREAFDRHRLSVAAA